MEMILLPVTLLTIILLIFFKNRRKIINVFPPGPPGLPLIGNLHQLDKTTPLHLFFWQLSKKYGPLVSMKLGSKSVLVVSSAEIAEEVMKKHDHVCCSRVSQLGTQKISYNNSDVIFGPYTDYWRGMRKMCVLHLFSSKKVQSFRPIRVDEVSRMIREITEDASQSKLTNLSDVVISLTSTIICRVAFGKRYGKEDQERTSFFQMIEEVQQVMIRFYFSDYFPLIGWLDKLTGAIAHADDVFNKMDSLYQEFIDNHLDANRPESMDDDIIDTLLKLREEEGLTMDHIKAMLMNVFLAGTETSSIVVVWAMTELIKSPAAMTKVQAEIRKLMGKRDMVDEDDCQKFPYLRAVVKEAMRLYPPVPLLIPRETLDRCTIGGYEIQPKTLLYVNAWAIGRDPKIWENPDEFLPDRFLNSDIDYKGQHFMLVPFGAGRRICPGISMGIATVELILANLLYLFDWSLPSGVKKEDIDTDPLPGLGMHKKNALWLQANYYRS